MRPPGAGNRSPGVVAVEFMLVDTVDCAAAAKMAATMRPAGPAGNSLEMNRKRIGVDGPVETIGVMLIEGEQGRTNAEKEEGRNNAHQTIGPDGPSCKGLGGGGHVALHDGNRPCRNVLADATDDDDPKAICRCEGSSASWPVETCRLDGR